jgi:hypothetical protein
MSFLRSSFIVITFVLSMPAMGQTDAVLATLQPQIEKARAEFDQISAERKTELEGIADFVSAKVEAGVPARLTFICTHNSRRSHLSQIWAQTAAAFYGIPGVETYSGGTEATACNPRTVKALRRAGFSVVNPTPEKGNPRYLVQYAEEAPPLEAFSKVYDQGGNPDSEFAAVMTCSDADHACPMVRGCESRFAVPYIDPKVADDTAAESATYDERSEQIAREMLYLMSQVER